MAPASPINGIVFVHSAIEDIQPFGRDHAVLAKLFNDWKLSGVLTVASSRPIDAKVLRRSEPGWKFLQ